MRLTLMTALFILLLAFIAIGLVLRAFWMAIGREDFEP